MLRDVQQGLIKQKRKPDQEPPKYLAKHWPLYLASLAQEAPAAEDSGSQSPGTWLFRYNSEMQAGFRRGVTQTMMATTSMASGRKASAVKYQRGAPWGHG